MTVQSYVENLTFSSNVPQGFKFSTGQPGVSPFLACRITNNSPYTVTIRFGSDPSTFTLLSGQGNVWAYNQSQGSILFSFPSGQASSATAGSIIIETSDVGAADFPGSYPSNGQLSFTEISGPVTLTGPVTVEQATPSSLNALTIGGIPVSTFGTGADGAVTISANTTLTRDWNYTDLTVDAGVTLSTGGYIIRCTGTLTNNGTIDNSASGTTPGATGSLQGGALGVSTASAANGLSPSSATIEGGSGGSTGSYSGGVTIAPLTSSYPLVQGASMSGGGSGSATAVSPASAFSGAGGGVVLIAASAVTGTSGVVSALGGNALTESAGGTAGGGGGGVIGILSNANPSGLTYNVNGGTGSSNGSTDTSYNGSAGQVLVYVA